MFTGAVMTALLALPLLSGAAGGHTEEEWHALLEPLVKQAMAEHHVPGLAVGVVENGEVVYTRGFGVRNVETGEPVTTRSLFHMASVSKPFVATAIQQLAEQGELDLDQTVQHYLPHFQIADPRAATITIRQMLSHTSGMPDVMNYHWDEPEDDEEALERYVRSLRDQKLVFAPGTDHRYSNMAFEVLGHLIAEVSGMCFEDYVLEEILLPLGMEDSTFYRPDTPEELRTSGHLQELDRTQVSRVYPYHRAHAPSSTLHSSADDMCRWILLNLGRGTLDDGVILTRSAAEDMWRPCPQAACGMSWFLQDVGGTRMVNHSGSDIGFKSFLGFLPEKNGGVVVMGNSNSAGPAIGKVRNAVLTRLVEGPGN